jgi:predicted MFS family arabinose efflux permease
LTAADTKDAGGSPLRYALGGMFAMLVAMGVGRFVFTPILPSMMRDAGLTPAGAGIVASANYAGYLLGALLASHGWAGGRERNLFYLGLWASAFLCFVMALADGVAAFSAIRFLAGMASAFVMVFGITIVFSHIDAGGRAHLRWVHFAGLGLGIAASAIVVTALVVVHLDWRAEWGGSAILSLIGVLFAGLLVGRGPLRDDTPQQESGLPRSTALYAVIIAYGIFGFGYIITATFLVAIVHAAHAGQVFEGLVWLATGLAATPSVLIWSAVTRRIGLVQTFALGCMVEAAGVAASVILPGPAGPMIGGILLGGTFVAVTAFGLEAGRRLAPQAPRRVLALMTVAFGTGQIAGPLAAGYLASASGSFESASLAAAAALTLAAAVAISARP